MESRLVVNGNPPELFDLVADVLAIEEIDHPFHAHKTALQQEETIQELRQEVEQLKK